jgi:hypothetical protein
MSGMVVLLETFARSIASFTTRLVRIILVSYLSL